MIKIEKHQGIDWQSRGSVKIRTYQLKREVTRILPSDSTLRQLILNEADELDASEFIIKVSDWLQLLDIEIRS